MFDLFKNLNALPFAGSYFAFDDLKTLVNPLGCRCPAITNEDAGSIPSAEANFAERYARHIKQYSMVAKGRFNYDAADALLTRLVEVPIANPGDGSGGAHLPPTAPHPTASAPPCASLVGYDPGSRLPQGAALLKTIVIFRHKEQTVRTTHLCESIEI